jgi:DNA-binding transcriptional regulator GbsR (MarR family)
VSARNPMSMTLDEIHAEIRMVRQQLSQQVQRLHDLSTVLARRSRREGSRDTMRLDIAYANAWLRFSTALRRGMDRAASSDRLMRRKAEQQVQEQASVSERRPASIERTIVANPVEDFEAVYGEIDAT